LKRSSSTPAPANEVFLTSRLSCQPFLRCLSNDLGRQWRCLLWLLLLSVFLCALSAGQEGSADRLSLPDTPKPTSPKTKGLFARWIDFYKQDWFGTAPEYAIVNFLQKEVSSHDFLSDFLNDKKGQRTSYATRYSENTITWCHWIGTTVQLRPEVRFEHAWDRPAYDNGHHYSQFTVASDLIFHF